MTRAASPFGRQADLPARPGVRAFLREGPYEDVEGWLRGIEGIGPWSAAFVLIRGLRRMERASMESRLGEAAGRVYRGGRPLTESVQRVAARYGRWQGY